MPNQNYKLNLNKIAFDFFVTWSYVVIAIVLGGMDAAVGQG
ncbi:hypothetical protein [uncultured Acinetobacter sp.]|nr:hypothetical protein [uncultured Acinetobacter sp.]